MELVKKGDALFDKRVFAPTRAFSRMKCVKTHSLRAKYFSRRTRRREKWMEHDSRPAGRELCEALLTVCIKPRGYPRGLMIF